MWQNKNIKRSEKEKEKKRRIQNSTEQKQHHCHQISRLDSTVLRPRKQNKKDLQNNTEKYLINRLKGHMKLPGEWKERTSSATERASRKPKMSVNELGKNQIRGCDDERDTMPKMDVLGTT